MARLVVLSEGYTGRTYELKVEKTTVGRLEDNAFQIPDPSVSSHHCEIILKGEEVIVKDLNSTNGSYINGEQVTEAPLKSGQILRLGQIDVRLETTPPPSASGKQKLDRTTVITGVKLKELEEGTKSVNFEKEGAFKKKSNKATKIFIIVGVILFVAIIVLLALAVLNFKKS